MDSEQLSLKWEEGPLIPSIQGNKTQPGLAGAFIGISGNNLIIAGGSNFGNSVPWKGASKIFHKAIYVLQKDEANNYKWIDQQLSGELNFPVAYGASITLDDGIICIGGESPEGSIRNVFKMVWSNGRMLYDTLPDLPVPLSNSGATSIGSVVYVAGGMNADGQSDSFFSLDLNLADKGWTKLNDLPAPLSHAVVVSQSDGNETSIYVIGGRKRNEAVSDFYDSVWKYAPSSGKWVRDGSISNNGEKSFGLSAGTGVPYESDKIILFGGDIGVIFNQVERLLNSLAIMPDSPEKQKVQSEKDSIQENHQGFCRDILLYNTVTHDFSKIGDIPGKSQVTTTAVRWGNEVIIPSGEIRPGVRTPEIKILKIRKPQHRGSSNVVFPFL